MLKKKKHLREISWAHTEDCKSWANSLPLFSYWKDYSMALKNIYFQKENSRKDPAKNSKNIHYHKCHTSVYTWMAFGTMKSLSDIKNMHITNSLWSFISGLRHRLEETWSWFYSRSRSMQKMVKPWFAGTALRVSGRFGLEEYLDFAIWCHLQSVLHSPIWELIIFICQDFQRPCLQHFNRWDHVSLNMSEFLCRCWKFSLAQI